MGIALNAVKLLSGAVSAFGDDLTQKRVLTLGVQDCYFNYETLLAFLERHQIKHRRLEPDNVISGDGLQYHAKRYSSNIHQITLFETLGFARENIESMDVIDDLKPTYVHDLNKPVPDTLLDRFDLIIDGGTVEHVFSMRDCFENLIRMCRVGGLCVHIAQADLLNHGFYNFNACLFDHVYRVNGFRHVDLKYIALPYYDAQARDRYYLEFDVQALDMTIQPYYILAVFACYLKERLQQFRIPVQGEMGLPPPSMPREGLLSAAWQSLPKRLTGKLNHLAYRSVILSFIARAAYTIRARAKRIDL
jgi:hypothetical protein